VTTPPRTSDVSYGEQYWGTLDGGAGYTDSIMWQDIAHIVHELVGVDKEAGVDNALKLRLLDVGCAFGFFLRHMRRRGYDVRGVDYSRYALEHAPEDIVNYVSWFDLTAEEQLSHWHKPFDVVTCFETLEHIPFNWVPTALGHLWSALAPGGVLIATICVQGMPDTHSDPTHVSIILRDSWVTELEKVGFVIDERTCRQLRWFWLFSQHKGVIVARKPVV
jgi:SAM-dependent methyltransferase